MEAQIIQVLLLLLAVTGFSVLARWLPWPDPITLVGGGILIGFLPGLELGRLDPDIFFVLFLPPLLFADGWQMPLREFKRVQREIFSLALGLVLVATFLVGFVVKLLVPDIPWGMAFAVGALISPTDAVAVSAITSKLNLPNRLVTIINGESLVNDASGLVAFRFALLSVTLGSISFGGVVQSFLYLAIGGIALGALLGFLVGKLRDAMVAFRSTDPYIETTLSLATPFAAYIFATTLDVSPILAVVAAGLYSGWRDPIRMDVETRQTAWSVWSIILFWLNGLAFLLLGLTGPEVIEAASAVFTSTELVLYPLILAGVGVGIRMVWVFAGAYLVYYGFSDIRQAEPKPDPRHLFITGWSGIRGAVTLAAALSIPLTLVSEGEAIPFPGRVEVVFLSLGVIAVTIFIHGTTLGPLIRLFKIEPDSSIEEEERKARIIAVKAGLKALEQKGDAVKSKSAQASLLEVVSEYEHRLAVLTSEGEARENARDRICSSRSFELTAVLAERQAIDDLWSRGIINDQVHRPLQVLLDHEEAMLRKGYFDEDFTHRV